METQAVREVDTATFTEFINGDTPTVIDFWAPWCGPCRALAPTIEKLAHDLGDRARVGKLNIDENPSIAAKFGIASIPTVVVFEDGAPRDKLVGIRPYEDYLNAVES